MAMSYTDILGFAEIGGVGEMIYHNVQFPEYEIQIEGTEIVVYPKISLGTTMAAKTDYAMTGQKLLASLCNLYKKINDPSYKLEKSYIDLIMDWCRENTHPYQIDYLYDEIHEEGFDIKTDAWLLEKDGIFTINDFVHDLAPLCNAFALYHALDQLEIGNDYPARHLYYEGRFEDGLSIFEKYKGILDGETPIKYFDKYLQEGEQPFVKNPLDDYDMLLQRLLSCFPDFRMRLKINPRDGRVVYSADVQSVFDIAWYTLSRLVADDAPPKDVDNEYDSPEGSILSCLCCGDFFIRRTSRHLYCDNPNCQAERKRKNRRDCDARKRVSAAKSKAAEKK